MPNQPIYNYLIITTDKFLKYTLLIPGNEYYNAVKWG